MMIRQNNRTRLSIRIIIAICLFLLQGCSKDPVANEIKRLQDSNENVRKTAAEVLGESKDPRAIKPLISMLGDSTSNVRSMAELALIKFGTPVKEPSGINIADGHWRLFDLTLRPFVTKPVFIDGLVSDATIAALLTTLKTNDKNLCRASAKVLASIPNAQMIELLVTTIKEDERSEVLFIAAEALGSIGDPRAVESLVSLLKHNDSKIRAVAATALGNTGNKKTVEPLIAVINDDNKNVRDVVIDALVQLGSLAVDSLLVHLNDSDIRTRVGIIETLADINDPRTIPPLIACLREPTPKSIQDAAMQALIEMDKVLDVLNELEDPRVVALLNAHTNNDNENIPSKLVALDIKLPKPMFKGTPQDTRVPHLEKPLGMARLPFFAPEGTKNVAAGKRVSGSDEEPIIGELEMITNGDKEAADGSYVELGPFDQYVTIDLEAMHEIYAVLVWHYHKQPRVYFDVVVQVADDPDFIENVRTVFNNDIDNSAGLGAGRDTHYSETYEGKLISVGHTARYVRLYSNGNTSNDLNHYIEVEVYGRPVLSSGQSGRKVPQVVQEEQNEIETVTPTRKTTESKLVALDIKLPKPMFIGTPQNIYLDNIEKPLGRPRPPFLAPEGTKNIAAGKPVSGSDEEPIIGELDMITDGDKEATDGSYVELGPFAQYVTIDLEAMHEIYAVLVWHYHKQPRVYFDVVVQVADDPDFITNVRTVFNNDIDNSAGLGIGKNMHYTETNEGKLIDTGGVAARYIRMYSNGNTTNDLNHYIEVEVYGRPVLSGGQSRRRAPLEASSSIPQDRLTKSLHGSAAEGDIQNASKTKERIVQNHIQAGSIHEANEEWEKAIEAYTQALRLEPDHPEVKGKLAASRHNLYLSRAQAAESTGDLEKAIRLYTTAISHEQVPSTQAKLDSVKRKLQAKTSPRREYDELGKISYVIGTQIAQVIRKQNVELTLEPFKSGLNDALTGNNPALSQDEIRQISNSWKRYLRARQAAEKAKVKSKARRLEFEEMEKVSYIIGIQVARQIKRYDIEVDADSLAQGLEDVLTDRKMALSMQEMNAVYKSWQARLKRETAVKKAKEADENLTKGNAFLAANKTEEGVKALPSGLQYKVIREGTGNIPIATDKVKVHYRGRFIDGKEFDSSYKWGKPTTFGVTQVIKGWTEALQLMKEGAKWELYIPPNLAYGKIDRSTIPSNSTLIFEVELIEIVKPAKSTAVK